MADGGLVVPIVLAGGLGSQMWPLSRDLHPKQFLALTGERTLLQQTLSRLAGLPTARPIVVALESQRFLVAEQLREIGVAASIVLEPDGRQTAASVAVAASLVPDATVLVLPTDHLVRDPDAWRSTLLRGIDLAADGELVAFGVAPTDGDPELGWLLPAEDLRIGRRVARFVEKPDRVAARAFRDEGWWWNSGMLVARASRLLAALLTHAPDVSSAARRALAGATRDRDFIRLDASAWAAVPARSLDVAVLAHVALAAIPLDAGWADLHSFAGLRDAGTADAAGNVTHGDVRLVGAHGVHVHATDRLVAAVGIRDLVVVETADAVLVVDKHRVHEIRDLVEALRTDGREEVQHLSVARPWGSYTLVDRGPRFQVKRLSVAVGAALSLQRHRHRAEHWVVVRGRARVTRGDATFELGPDESTFIPCGTVHRLENAGPDPLEIVEVQTGERLDEADIERLSDPYGR